MNNRNFPLNFIGAGSGFSTLDSPVAAPIFRKKFELPEEVYGQIESAQLLIGVCGFYELYCNGRNLTKGALAPYISNPDDLIYYDEIQAADFLTAGENVIGIWLGNGLMNNPGGYIWDFDKVSWRGAPCFALELDICLRSGEHICIGTDETFLVASSPILFDDYRIGEVYDARQEKEGWAQPGYDDSLWKQAETVKPPRGEARLCMAEPIVEKGRHKPVKITRQKDGWLFSFEKNSAGVPRLKIRGEPGQKIILHHGEVLQNGELYLKNMTCDPDLETQVDIYICKGGGEEYQPRFTYHGFQHVYVEGLKEEQVSEETVTYTEMHSDLKERGVIWHFI